MFEVGLFHEIQYVLPVEGNSVDDLDLVQDVFAQRQDLFYADALSPRLRKINGAVNCIRRYVHFST